MQTFFDIIASIESDAPNVNPTQIYNEGWMTRLLMYHSIKEKTKLQCLDFGEISKWISEALIASPFIKAKDRRKGYTYPDIAFGDFTINYANGGEVEVNESTRLFGIIEAKMGSSLSAGTKHCSNYNQGSRNLACLSSKTYNIKNHKI